MVSGEHILVPLASRGADIDSIFNLNETGTFIWEKIDGHRTVAEIIALVASDFQVSKDRATLDCGEFFAQLLEVRAVEFVPADKE
jgi:hypothetical protein